MRIMIAIAGIVLFSSGFIDPKPASQPAKPAPTHPAPLIEEWLIKGDLARAEAAASKALAADKRNDDLRFQLGVVQFLRGIERLSQSLYANGFRDYGEMVPFLRLPMGQNPQPKQISYEDLRKIIQNWLDDLAKVEASLEPVHGKNTLLPLHPGLIRMDLNGDGKADDDETFWRIFERYAGAGLSAKDAQDFLICFDLGDVAWLRGYCHLLAGLGEIVLAHDFRDLFERTGTIFFLKIKTPHECLYSPARLWQFGGSSPDISDVIAFIHLINLPVAEPDRMRSALKHLQIMVKLSAESWDLICQETDDDHEWIPNPLNGQKSVIAGLTMTTEQLTAWRQFLTQLGKVLDGKVLLPHWRFPEGKGINLRKVFMEPRQFDLVLWVQGTAATPYIESGEVLDNRIWGQLDRAFRGGFVSYALWFN